MARIEIRKRSDKKMPNSAGYQILIDDNDLNDVISKVTSVHLDFDAPEIPELTIKAKITDIESVVNAEITTSEELDGEIVETKYYDLNRNE